MKKKIESLKSAYEAVRHAEAHMFSLLGELFPSGAPIRWKRGRHLQAGYVRNLGYRDSLIVANSRTGAIVKISAYDIIQVLETKAEEQA